MKQLGVAGLGALLGASQARKAAASGQAGAQQLQQLATPYQQQGQQLQAQAQAGTLTPAGQQSLQALQAQVAQGAQARGGVGVQQGAQAVEALRQQLLAGQYQLGLQISGIGDKIATGAIQAGMQADQYTNQLTSSYFNNIARIALVYLWAQPLQQHHEVNMAELDLLNYPGSKLGSITSPAPSVLKPSTKQTPLRSSRLRSQEIFGTD